MWIKEHISKQPVKCDKRGLCKKLWGITEGTSASAYVCVAGGEVHTGWYLYRVLKDEEEFISR